MGGFDMADVGVAPVLLARMPVMSEFSEPWFSVVATVAIASFGVGALGWILVRPHVAKNKRRRKKRQSRG